MKTDSNDSFSTHSPKPRTRQVNSRFMSPIFTGPPEPGSASPTTTPSPVLRRWPSSAKKTPVTLADHIGIERLHPHNHQNQNQNQQLKPTKSTGSVFASLRKQRSCREISSNNNGSEENELPIIGRSMRYSFPTKSSSSSSAKKPSSQPQSQSFIVPGRHSLDENALNGISDFSKNSIDSESDNTSFNSLPRSWSSRKLGREVPSKYRAPRKPSDSDVSTSDESWVMKKLIGQKAIKRANSLIGFMSSKSQWALSPGRSGSPPRVPLEGKEKTVSFSRLRPQNKGVGEKILSMGLDLFRSKKCSTSVVGIGNFEAVHELRVLENRLMQWRFVNAKALAVNDTLCHQAESNLIYAWDGLAKLKHSVMQKKIELEREKLQMKLYFVLHSQMKLLETWGSMERQYLAAITVMKESLHSVVCKVPLLEGAKVDIQLASLTQQDASDLTASIKSMLSTFIPSACKTAELLSELAEVVAQEKLLLQEFHDLFETMCILECARVSSFCYCLAISTCCYCFLVLARKLLILLEM
ncbi:hypothetical protein RJT34_31211 [Clitoria ternatea]|uniref:QWRF motif-containing protein 3 n=1 Tax=Clitoria ternatea TaxID=43366 RepID=A0AAN9I154_CLITE